MLSSGHVLYFSGRLKVVACTCICMRGVIHKCATGMWNIEEAFKTFYLAVVKYGPSEMCSHYGITPVCWASSITRTIKGVFLGLITHGQYRELTAAAENSNPRSSITISASHPSPVCFHFNYPESARIKVIICDAFKITPWLIRMNTLLVKN